MTDTPAPAPDTAAIATDAKDPATEQQAQKDNPMIPKSRLDQEIAKRSAADAQVSAMADTILAGVPDHLKALVPDTLSPAEKVAWYDKAKSTGIFAAADSVPATDSGKPKTSPQPEDLSKLPPAERMSHGYGA